MILVDAPINIHVLEADEQLTPILICVPVQTLYIHTRWLAMRPRRLFLLDPVKQNRVDKRHVRGQRNFSVI